MTKPYSPSLEAARYELVETISPAALTDSWRQDFGIDVSRFFRGVHEIHLLRDIDTGQLVFDPPIEGDAAFYQALRDYKWYHPQRKTEHQLAASWYKANVPSGGGVLDVGAGIGLFAKVLGHVPYIGLETDPDTISRARIQGLNLIDMDIEAYARSEHTHPVAMTTAFQVLEHVSDPDRFVSGMVSATRPGGFVVIGVPNAETYLQHLPDFMLNAPPHHVSWWTKTALTALMERSGLTICATYECALEPWERQIWWMAQVSNWLGKPSARFGCRLRARKIVAYLFSAALQWLPLSSKTKGSTLLMIGQKD